MFNTTRTDGISAGVVIWQSKNTQVAQGGFTLDDSLFAEGEVILAGTPIGYDEATRLAKVGKYGVAQAGATDTATQYKLLKGHVLKVGMEINSGAGTAQAITVIDTTDANFDLITVGTTIGVTITTGDAYVVDDLGVTGKQSLLYAPVVIGGNGLADVTVVLRGTVYARRIAPVPASIQANMPLIIFSESF